YAARRQFFADALATLEPNNAQGEYYLTDIVAFAAKRGQRVASVASNPAVMAGVNDRAQLALPDRAMSWRTLPKQRSPGGTIRDGARIEDGVEIGGEAVIESFAVLRGKTRVGARAVVDVGCVLTNADVGEDVALKPYSVATDAIVRAKAQVGPFSHLRPESD